MDIITDLTSQSVSFIVILQDMCRSIQFKQQEASTGDRLWEIMGAEQDWRQTCNSEARVRFKEVLWISNMRLIVTDRDKEEGKDEKNNLFDSLTFQIASSLLNWLQKHSTGLPEGSDLEISILGPTYGTVFTTPHEWRTVIRSILYRIPSERTFLARILYYMPIQVILALGGNRSKVYKQRVYQVWVRHEINKDQQNPFELSEQGANMLCSDDQHQWTKWWNEPVLEFPESSAKNEKKNYRWVLATRLLENETYLVSCLKARNNPLPFETFFRTELKEIYSSRGEREKVTTKRWKIRKNIDPFKTEEIFKRINSNQDSSDNKDIRRNAISKDEKYDIEFAIESLAGFPDDNRRSTDRPPSGQKYLPLDENEDPLKEAKRMRLIGLAFSGGGIRSATFNLGVLQLPAERNILSRVDYLSTVSGGGYIGSWAASWIKRTGSVHKVEDRLNPNESIDPMAEEVRPIRWLRMYSNYLTPNASIMSADSWTLGVTWLRNTLINQLLLLLLLCSFLSAITLLFSVWKWFSELPPDQRPFSLDDTGKCWAFYAGLLSGRHRHENLQQRATAKGLIKLGASSLSFSNTRWARCTVFIFYQQLDGVDD